MPGGDGRGLAPSGLDGGNPLGFLAAVGTLNTAALADPGGAWRMKWAVRDGRWFPALSANRAVSCEELVGLLLPVLRRESTPEFDFAKDLTVSPEKFGDVARGAQCHASSRDRRYADFVAALGCEAVVAKDGKSIEDTALRTMSGAGHQHFLGTMKQLHGETESEHLHKALFDIWDYSDVKRGLRWDPEEDRRYALRWGNPKDTSKNPIKTMWGANRIKELKAKLADRFPDGKPRTPVRPAVGQ